MDIEYILNDALNKALCQKGRIQHPNSNTISEFVTKYLQTEKLAIQSVGSSCLWIVQDKENNILYTSFEKQKAIDKRKDLIKEYEITLDVNKLLVD